MAGFTDVRMRGFRDRLSVDDFAALVLGRAAPLSIETVPLREAAGRALARETVADCSVPGFDRAMMDGYAVRCADAGPLSVIGTALPGKPFAGVVGAGEAVRITTGAPMPSGADAVLPVEQSQEEGALRVLAPVPAGKNIARIGEDVKAGATLLPAGRVLRPQDLGLLASAGLGTVFVHRVPKVSIVVTGDELLPVGSKPTGCRIVDSNSVMLAALVRRDGGEPDVSPIVADQRDALRETLLTADGDLILVSGGSSVGQEDHVPGLLASEGELLAHGVALRPGSPTGFGELRGRLVFLLPGNPVACLAGYDLFAGRALRRMVGKPTELPYFRFRAVLASPLASATGRVDYVRVRLEEGRAHPLPTGGSLLRTATEAAGFVLVPAETERLEAGATVEVRLYE